LSSSPWPGCA